jgi:hypothetical protein
MGDSRNAMSEELRQTSTLVLLQGPPQALIFGSLALFARRTKSSKLALFAGHSLMAVPASWTSDFTHDCA